MWKSLTFPKSSYIISDAHSRFVQEMHQEPISLVGAGIEQFLNLVLGDGLGALSFLFFLLQDIFRNR